MPDGRRARMMALPWGRRGRVDVAQPVPEPGAEPVPAVVAPSGRFADTFRALRNRNYRIFYIGQSISLTGTWMQTIAQAILVLDITNSKVAVGTVTMLQFLPITVFVLFAGVIADRVPKRNFLVATQTLAMAQALTLAALVWSGHVQLWHVYVLALVLGLSNAFDQPTRQAFVVEMVGKEDLMNAVALNSGMFNGARLIGPAVGGFLIAAFGVRTAFLLNGLSFLPVIIGLLMMDARRFYAVAQRRVTAHPLTELREGLAYAFRTPSAMLIIVLVGIIGTFGYNFTVMLPLVNRYVLHGGDAGLGLLTAAVGAGALVSALAIASRRDVTRRTLFVGAAAFSLLLACVAVSRWFPLTMAALLLLGIANTAFASTANTSLQLATPDHLRGRVMALYMLLFAGSTPIGGYLTGFMAEHVGVQATVGIEAALCLAGVAAGLAYYATHRDAIGARA